MQIILHRINTKKALQNTPNKFGVEIDIRSEGNKLILGHDRFKEGEDFYLLYLELFSGVTIFLGLINFLREEI